MPLCCWNIRHKGDCQVPKGGEQDPVATKQQHDLTPPSAPAAHRPSSQLPTGCSTAPLVHAVLPLSAPKLGSGQIPLSSRWGLQPNVPEQALWPRAMSEWPYPSRLLFLPPPYKPQRLLASVRAGRLMQQPTLKESCMSTPLPYVFGAQLRHNVGGFVGCLPPAPSPSSCLRQLAAGRPPLAAAFQSSSADGLPPSY